MKRCSWLIMKPTCSQSSGRLKLKSLALCVTPVLRDAEFAITCKKVVTRLTWFFH